ncbi:trypsin-like serine protease [Bradyrhizobium sp. 2TAF24]|uniref:trypsin-like serine protease n=1 Tax=Bradyrhizobium sp. 2TAF24 TaxID=3233011 RepID=UPI003F9072C3
MTIKTFRIDYHRDGYQLDGKTRAKYMSGPKTGQYIIDFDAGSGGAYGGSIALGNGIFLTASHLFDSVRQGDSGQKVRFIGYGMTVAGTADGQVKNLEGWDPIAAFNNVGTNKPLNDLAELKSSAPVANSDVSPVIMFADQSSVTRVLSGKTINNGGLITQNSGTFIGAPVSGQFSVNLATADHDSGGPATINIAGTQYVAGILSTGAVDATGANVPPSVYSYLNPTSFYTVMNDVANGGSQDFSKVPPDLIYGGSDKEYIRGTVRRSNIILNGSNDVILAGGTGDIVNSGIGNHDVIFAASAVGQKDQGTTFIIGTGNSTIVGGGPNDRVALLADRIWSRGSGKPSQASLQANSDIILLTGGIGNRPGDKIGSYVVPELGYWYFDASSPATVAEARSANPLDWLKGDFDYYVSYDPQRNSDGTVDLTVEVHADDPTAGGSILWRGSTVIKNYHTGDFGLTFTVDTSYAEYQKGLITDAQYYATHSAANSAFLPSATHSQYAVDDTAFDWNGRNAFWAPEDVSDATIKSDLATLLTTTHAQTGTAAALVKLVQAMSTFDASPSASLATSSWPAAGDFASHLAANAVSHFGIGHMA